MATSLIYAADAPLFMALGDGRESVVDIAIARHRADLPRYRLWDGQDGAACGIRLKAPAQCQGSALWRGGACSAIDLCRRQTESRKVLAREIVDDEYSACIEQGIADLRWGADSNGRGFTGECHRVSSMLKRNRRRMISGCAAKREGMTMGGHPERCRATSARQDRCVLRSDAGKMAWLCPPCRRARAITRQIPAHRRLGCFLAPYPSWCWNWYTGRRRKKARDGVGQASDAFADADMRRNGECDFEKPKRYSPKRAADRKHAARIKARRLRGAAQYALAGVFSSVLELAARRNDGMFDFSLPRAAYPAQTENPLTSAGRFTPLLGERVPSIGDFCGDVDLGLAGRTATWQVNTH